MTLIDI